MAGFDVDRMLSMERRTGIKDDDLSDFIGKVDAVQAAIQAMKDGTLDPKDVRIPGIPTPEEKAQAENERRRREEDRLRQDAQERARKKVEERERWWRGAELMYGARQQAGQLALTNGGGSTEGSGRTLSEAERSRLAARYSAEYSRWDRWTPDDPATQDEEASRQAEEDQKLSEQFERSNPDFCKTFTEDLQQREKAREKKESDGNAARLKGNQYFKGRKWDRALELYMDSLRACPYVTATLGNIAQAHLKLQQWEDAAEFCERTLHCDRSNVKGLSRRATARVALGDRSGALRDLSMAVELEPANKDLLKQHRELLADMEDEESEQAVSRTARRLQGGPDKLTEPPQPQDTPTAGAAGPPSMEGILADLEASELTIADQLLEEALGERVSPEQRGQLPRSYALEQLQRLLGRSRQTRVHLRTGGGLARLVQVLVTATEPGGREDDMGTPLEELLVAIAAAVEDERKSQLMMASLGGLEAAAGMLEDDQWDASARGSACVLIKACLGCDAVHRKAAKSQAVLRGLLAAVKDAAMGSRGLEAAAGTLQYLLVGPDSQSAKATLLLIGPGGAAGSEEEQTQPMDAVVCLSLALGRRVKGDRLASGSKAISSEASEALCGALTNLALHEDFQAGFAGQHATAALVGIMRLPWGHSWTEKAGAMTSLMNACSEKTGSVRAAVHGAGATGLILAWLAAMGRTQVDVPPPVACCRYSGLLSRLMAYPPAVTELLTPRSWTYLLKEVSRITPKASAAPETDTWREEREHLVRVCASVLRAGGLLGQPATTQIREELLDTACAMKLAVTMMQMLPAARTSQVTGQVTGDSVGLAPESRVSANLGGNICSALIQLLSADGETASRLAEQIAGRSSPHGGIEKLLSLFANSEDGPVRKNSAICLAKLMRHPQYKQRITDLRGMEMLMHAGKSLV